MDPNTVPIIPEQTSSRRNIIVISVLVLIGLLFGGIFYINSKKTPSQTLINPPPDFRLKANRGTVKSISSDRIIIASGSATFEYPIDSLTAFMNKGIRVNLTDVKVGQEVNIAATEGTSAARLISIVK